MNSLNRNLPGYGMSFTHEEIGMVADTIRTLTMDAVQKANSGHPGMPMGCAEIGAVLWLQVLNHNPTDSDWINRDRFILSAGHGSMLLYSLLHLSGYDITIEDIKNFRQWGSITPGHPEHFKTRGVETTTGPLGQGFANGVGMAMAQELMGRELNAFGEKIIDHNIYGIVSDGDIMEGITSEAASLAGHMGLGRLIYIYDSNSITIDGDINQCFSDDVSMRFRSYNWHVLEIDGHSPDAILSAISESKSVTDRPSLIIANTSIGRGCASKEGDASCHGAPLGEEEVAASKVQLGREESETFHVPDECYEIFKRRGRELDELYRQWQERFSKVQTDEFRRVYDAFFRPLDLEGLRDEFPEFEEGAAIATRSASGKVLEVLFRKYPTIVGGSADLGSSNKSYVKGYAESCQGGVGRSIHFGVREHAMAAIMNGFGNYGGFIPYTATFLVFMDYMRAAMRIAALGKIPVIYIFSHDSFYVGEDGPTHQPVEHIASGRAMPNMTVIRPADAEETREAWLAVLARREGPSMLVLTRQNVPVIRRDEGVTAGSLSRGAYIIHHADNPDVVVYASGSEVSVSMDAAGLLEEKGIRVRVISFPSWEIFDEQDEEYRSSILVSGVPTVVVEAGISQGWHRYVGRKALFITMENYGSSAPAAELARRYGFTATAIAGRIEEYLGRESVAENAV